MRLSLKTRKSNGIPVTQAVHRHIARGNAARDRQDWPEAAKAYERAVALEPALAHIWVQLGHARKESGALTDAERAYRTAAQHAPDDFDPHLHLGHLRNREGDHAAAALHYIDAFKAKPDNIDAATGLHRVLARTPDRARGPILALLNAALRDGDEGEQPAPQPPGDHTTLVFDVSDLVSYYGQARLPTGIQRVQIEAINAALRIQGQASGGAVHVCCFIEGRDGWLEIPARTFRAITALSLGGGGRNDPAWVTTLNRLHLRLAGTSPFAFPEGATLVNLGTSWWLQNYFLRLRDAKARFGIRYVPLIHDLIPIMAPQHCVKDLTRDFISWALGVFTHADSYLAVSEASRRDLITVAATLGHTIDPDSIGVIPLDADFRKAGMTPAPLATLSKWNLTQGGYVLLVSTIESRKGHAVAFDAWLDLIERLGPQPTPKLVCVGNRGWLNGAVYQRLQDSAALAKHVVMLSGIADEDLALLYRACLFTIYPSLYEGWGLPITEALCYGKAVITTTASSMPQAGGEFALYVEPNAPGQLADAAERLIRDVPARQALERRISAGFRPRGWDAIAEQITRRLASLAARPPCPVAAYATARLGAFHPITRSSALHIWPGAGSGEAFRIGAGWHPPAPEGCRTRPSGGELAIGVPPDSGPLTLGLLLLGDQEDIEWRILVRSQPGIRGALRVHERRWISIPVHHPGDTLHLRFHTIPPAGMAPGFDEPPTIGIAGFFVHPQADEAAGRRLLDAIATGNLESVDAYREDTGPDLTPWDWEPIWPPPPPVGVSRR